MNYFVIRVINVLWKAKDAMGLMIAGMEKMRKVVLVSSFVFLYLSFVVLSFFYILVQEGIIILFGTIML